jgi:serine/threonine-protein kinase
MAKRQLQAGQQFGPYRVESFVDSGGMGEVYRAVDTQNGDRIVALKVLKSHLADDQVYADRFLREGASLQRLRHPNIVAVYDHGELDGLHYIAMQFVDGQSLARALDTWKAENTAVDYRQAFEIGSQVARALGYAHECGIVHRDVKTSNILQSKDGRYLLTDFGIAFDTEFSRLTSSRMQFGTAEYMSPEQFESSSVDARSDVYSLGVVLYELTAGRLPFIGSAPALYSKHRSTPPPPLPKGRVPPEVEAVILKALQKNPDARYADADQLLVALKSVLDPAVSKAGVGGRRTALVAGLGLAGLLGISAVFAVTQLSGRQSDAARTAPMASGTAPVVAPLATASDLPRPSATATLPAPATATQLPTAAPTRTAVPTLERTATATLAPPATETPTAPATATRRATARPARTRVPTQTTAPVLALATATPARPEPPAVQATPVSPDQPPQEATSPPAPTDTPRPVDDKPPPPTLEPTKPVPTLGAASIR